MTNLSSTEETRPDGRTKEEVLPIAWFDWDDLGDFIEFNDVIFLKDFGPIKKGEEYTEVYVSFTHGILQACKESGNATHELKFEAKVVDDGTNSGELGQEV